MCIFAVYYSTILQFLNWDDVEQTKWATKRALSPNNLQTCVTMLQGDWTNNRVSEQHLIPKNLYHYFDFHVSPSLGAHLRTCMYVASLTLHRFIMSMVPGMTMPQGDWTNNRVSEQHLILKKFIPISLF